MTTSGAAVHKALAVPASRKRSIHGKILDVAGAAEFLGISEDTVYARVARRLLPFKRWGGRLVFIEAQLMPFFEALPGCSPEEAMENIRQRQG